MVYRCPKHDVIFTAVSDIRPPGSLASPDGKLLAHPYNGHPDCPQCQTTAVSIALAESGGDPQAYNPERAANTPQKDHE